MDISLTINGTEYELAVEGDTPLLWVLRDHLELTGTKFGCGIGQCGACTVHIDGAPRRSCITPVERVSGEVTTIEGLAPSRDELHPVQQAWLEHNVPQCGYCQSGQIMSAAALLAQDTSPDDDAIASAMSGNLCRCGTYSRVKAAIKSLSGENV